MRVVLFFIFIVSSLFSADFRLGAGAGYKKPILEIVGAFQKESGYEIEAVFGNMKQVEAQVKSADLALMIGDKSYLEKKSELSFNSFIDIGKGKAVLAYAKGVKVESIEDLTKKEIVKITIPDSKPDSKKAIYGIAASEILENSELKDKLNEKIVEVSTVPQATSYILTKEVEAGFINLTDALAHKDKIGGYITIDEALYSPIIITAGKLDGCKKECEAFLEFVSSKTAKKILEKYGL